MEKVINNSSLEQIYKELASLDIQNWGDVSVIIKTETQSSPKSNKPDSVNLPVISHEDRIRTLNSIPNEFGSENSNKWITKIQSSRTDSDRIPFNS